MATRQRSWESLSPKYRERLSRYGLTKSQYESGARPLAAARGHGATPEHGLKDAQKNPAKYGEYIRKRAVKTKPKVSGSIVAQAYALNSARDAAFLNIVSRLHAYYKFNEDTVRSNVYGGTTAESGNVKGMSLAEAQWTSAADTEELRSNAEPQYRGNPWFYH